MASNGYARKDCTGCLFYSTGKGYGEECTLRAEGFASDGMLWVSAAAYIRDPELKEKHDEPCEHRASISEIKDRLRIQYGIIKEVTK